MGYGIRKLPSLTQGFEAYRSHVEYPDGTADSLVILWIYLRLLRIFAHMCLRPALPAQPTSMNTA